MLAHVIGYTGEISEQELDLPEFAKYNQGDVVGKFGIEKQYNDTLMGVDGQRQVVVDNRGQVRQTLATKKAVAGKDLQLTIDLDLQTVAELAMDGQERLRWWRSIRASGEVLAMVSRPTFDPEQVRGAHQDQGLARDRRQSRTPHAEPGDSGGAGAGIHVQADRGAGGPGDRHHRRDTGRTHCSRRRGALRPLPALLVEADGHGTQSLHGGIVHSCDVYFYTLGAKLGIDNIAFYGDLVGFGQPTGIDLPHEKSRPDAFGEMEAAQLPHQVVCRRDALGGHRAGRADRDAAATGARHRRDRGGRQVVSAAHGEESLDQVKMAEWTLNPEHVKGVIDGMYGVVNEGGTGVRAALPHLEVCGKTGTAQLASNDFVKASAGGPGHEGQRLVRGLCAARATRKSWWWRCSSTASTASLPRPSCAT